MTDIDFPVDKYYAQQAEMSHNLYTVVVVESCKPRTRLLQVYVSNIKSGNDCGSLMSSAAEPAQNGGLETHTLKKIRTPNVDNPQEIMFPIVTDLALGFAQECWGIRPHNAVPE